MALLDQTLFGVVDKVQVAIDRLKQYEPPEGYYLAFSGGKDSCVIKELAKMARVKFDAHMNLTTVDPPELLKFVKKYHPDVIREIPERTMFQLIMKKGLPLRTSRFCCELLKEHGGKDRKVISGIRWYESINRKKNRKLYEQARCGQKGGKKYMLNPIIDWTDSDIWDFIRSNNLPYCELYDQGFTRIGCIGCPLINKNQRLKEIEKYPKIINAYKKAITIYLKNRKHKESIYKSQFKNADEMFHWWIHNPKDDGYTLTFNFDN